MKQALRGFQRVQINFGETLQEFAARVLGDAAQWVAVAAINRLAPPYVSESGGVGVARYGETLLVPGGSPATIDATTAEAVFGADIALDRGEISIDSGGAITLLAGRANLKQALEHRVRTTPGELLFHQEYGCDVDSLRGIANREAQALLARAYVMQALRRDDRISKVLEATAEANGDVVQVDAVAETVSGHPVDTTFRI